MVELASDKQASDVLLLDVSNITPVADYMIIMSADNTRQIGTLAAEFRSATKGHWATKHRQEGTPESGWMLIDFGDVIVHIFSKEQREHYSLDRVWGDARALIRIQ